jgi:predicted dehydrogenase
LRRDRELEVHVFSRTEKYAKECYKEFDAEGYFTSYEKVLNSNVDIVDLDVSHDAHEPMGVSAMRSKKHVMLEKPIARDEDEAIRLIETAKTTGVKFMVLENHYFDPSVWKAKELMEMLGGISLILLRNTRFNSPQGWRRVKDLMGGGALIDGGIHFVDTLLNLGGDYTSVNALCNSTFSGLEGEDTTVAVFKFKNGAVGNLVYSWASQSRGEFPHFEIYGKNGTIKEDYRSRVRIKPYGDLIVEWKNGEIQVISTEKVNAVKEEMRGFINAVERDSEVPMDPMIALRDLRAVRDIYRSCGEIKKQ